MTNKEIKLLKNKIHLNLEKYIIISVITILTLIATFEVLLK